jgi:cytochrome c-type biogenesis protein CcmH
VSIALPKKNWLPRSNNVPVSRLLLIIAAIIATATIGVMTLKPKEAAEPVAPERNYARPTLEKTIAEIEGKLKTNPGDAKGWQALGQAFVGLERFDEAATAYQRAVRLVPGKAENWSSLGEALMMAGKGQMPSDAKTAFSNALACDPKDTRARYYLGAAKDIAGDHQGAIDDWIALLRDSPKGAPWEAGVIDVLTQVATKEKIDVAGRLAAIGRAPQSVAPVSDQNAAIASMVGGLAAKLKASPKDVEGWIMLMRSYQALGRTEDAKRALASGLTANPDAADTLNAAASDLKLR